MDRDALAGRDHVLLQSHPSQSCWGWGGTVLSERTHRMEFFYQHHLDENPFRPENPLGFMTVAGKLHDPGKVAISEP